MQMTTTSTKPVPRPRVEGDRETEIYDAVIRLVVELGYDKLTFDAVAADVRASKATLYRKWATKAALVVDAVASRFCGDEFAVPDTGSLRGDLVVGACADGGLTSELPELIGSLVAALHRDADLYEAFRTRYLEPNIQRGFEIFARAQKRGEIGAGADLHQLSMILPALCIHETIVFGREIDRAGVLAIVDGIVLPACAATLH
jgi:AcrR family transcriptional regulator